MKKSNRSRTGIAFGAAFLGALTGCVGHVHGPSQAVVYAPPPPVYVRPGVVMQGDYVYYPGYQVYYSTSRRQYIYQEGRSWVSRPAPRVSANVLFTSPSVRLNFYDAPSIHHAAVVRQYPQHWAPPMTNPYRGQVGRDDGRRNYGNGHW